MFWPDIVVCCRILCLRTVSDHLPLLLNYTLSTHIVHSFKANKSLNYAIIISIAFSVIFGVVFYFVVQHLRVSSMCDIGPC